MNKVMNEVYPLVGFIMGAVGLALLNRFLGGVVFVILGAIMVSTIHGGFFDALKKGDTDENIDR